MKGGGFRGGDVRESIGYFEIEVLGGCDQPFGVLAVKENLALIATLALKHGRGVVHGVCQDVDVCVPPFDKLAVHPDFSIAVIICSSHCSLL